MPPRRPAARFDENSCQERQRRRCRGVVTLPYELLRRPSRWRNGFASFCSRWLWRTLSNSTPLPCAAARSDWQLFGLTTHDMLVELGGEPFAVAKESLDDGGVGARFQEASGEGVAQVVRRQALGKASLERITLEDAPESRLAHVIALARGKDVIRVTLQQDLIASPAKVIP